jgi:hypothetical protein
MIFHNGLGHRHRDNHGYMVRNVHKVQIENVFRCRRLDYNRLDIQFYILFWRIW